MTTLPTFDGSEPGPHHGHAGWPVSDAQILATVRAGLPVYDPDSPASVDQRPYREFAAKRGPNGK